jgi:DNA polymerase/3'-5' exonuclease PolX
LHILKFIVGDLTNADKTKYMGFCKLNKYPIRRIDIRMVGVRSFFPALIYFTGSYEFNQIMIQKAKKLGYKLNEYGLYDINNKIIHIKSEFDIFNILGMTYLEPENR